MKFIVKHLKGKFLAGLFVVIPVGITIFILKFLFNFTDGILSTGHAPRILETAHPPVFAEEPASVGSIT